MYSNVKTTSSTNNLNNSTSAVTPWDIGHHHYHSLAGSSVTSSNQKTSSSMRGATFFSTLDSALSMTQNQPSTSNTAGVSISLSNTTSSSSQQVWHSKKVQVLLFFHILMSQLLIDKNLILLNH